jgi:hypothetical protein
MNRVQIALLVTALGLLAVLFGWWLLRTPAEKAGTVPPPPVPSGPPQTPEADAEAISKLRREIELLRQGGKTKVVYRAGSADELASYRRWLDGYLGFASHGSPPRVTAPSGFRLLELPGVADLLAEEPAQKRGAGVLVLRSGEAQPWVLEVPHSFFDEGTLEIGLNAFVWQRARALLINTVHRYRALSAAPSDDATDTDDDESSPSDVAHAEASFFLTAHDACVDALGDVAVLQLHGFSDASAKADLVLSAAGSRADPVPVAQALERALGIRVAIYPTQIRKLGGTRNVQAHRSIASGRPFLHVEMSKSLRKQLTTDPERLRRFVAALLGSAG